MSPGHPQAVLVIVPYCSGIEPGAGAGAGGAAAAGAPAGAADAAGALLFAGAALGAPLQAAAAQARPPPARVTNRRRENRALSLALISAPYASHGACGNSARLPRGRRRRLDIVDYELAVRSEITPPLVPNTGIDQPAAARRRWRLRPVGGRRDRPELDGARRGVHAVVDIAQRAVRVQHDRQRARVGDDRRVRR